MNEYDVHRLVEVLRRDGYERTDDPEAADLVLIETCSIREKAEAKVASAAGRFKNWHSQPGKVLAIGGCVAQQEGENLLRRIPHADLTFGPDQIVNVPSLLRRVGREPGQPRRRIAATEVIDVEDYSFLDADPLSGDVRVTALVTIQKGCDNDCAYCVVPNTRGREVSRPPEEVLAEGARFLAAGARELTLIGQNVNSYHGIGMPDGDDFAELLARVDRLPGLRRLRFITSHPKDFTSKVARAFAELEHLASWLHLPVQSGSSEVLKAMKRDYTSDEYLAKLDELRSLVPDISISTDVIVGYPTETEADHEATLRLLERACFDSIYSFAYSPRPGTTALELPDGVPPAEKSRRLQEVQALQRGITAGRLGRMVGREVDVLVEGESRTGGQACGRTSGNHTVNFAPPPQMAVADLVGRLITVRIETARTNTLVGALEGVGGSLDGTAVTLSPRLDPGLPDLPTAAGPQGCRSCAHELNPTEVL